jgi:MerR family transcriptional regulator, copper efflux regulator
MNIGTVAERSGVSPKAIRYYESIGLVRPAERRPNGYRSYSLVDMRTLDFIKRARSLGFSVEEVRQLLDLWQNRSRRSAAVKALTSRHLEALDRKIEELMTIRKALADLVKRCHGDARPDCPILDDFEHREEVPHEAASPVEHRPRSHRHKEKS